MNKKHGLQSVGINKNYKIAVRTITEKKEQ